MKLFAFSKTYEGRKVLDFPGMELEPGKVCAINDCRHVKIYFSELYTGTMIDTFGIYYLSCTYAEIV